MTTFSEQFPIVFQALNVGFLQTLKLFVVTLVGSIPLGLIICFGSMSRWAPLGFLGRKYFSQGEAITRALENGETVKGRDDAVLTADMARNRARRCKAWGRLLLGFRPISLISRFVVWIIRGTPLMLQLLIIFYIPGYVLANNPWSFPEGRFAAAAVMFVINYACYFSEIYRGGIQGVPVGQQEAGQVLGMTKSQIFFKVTLLQVIKRVIPPMGNEFINLVKDTALARTIAVYEVLWMGEKFIKSKGIIWPLFYTAVFYLVFNGLLTLLFGWIEKKMDYFK